MFTRIYNILISILGESKQGGYDSGLAQYQFNCPNCREENDGIADNKYNLEINLELGKFHCWKCEHKGNLSYLIKRYGNRSLLKDYFDAINEIKTTQYLIFGIMNDTLTDDEEFTLKLPSSYTKIDLATCKNKRVVNYLKQRHISQEIIDFYEIGYTTWEDPKFNYRNRIIVPSYDSYGNLNYWVGRDFENKEGSKKTKYANPDAKKNEIVCHEDKIQWDADIVLVEGALDCIYYPNAIPLLGKKLDSNSALCQTLKDRANGKIFICLDNDTTIKEVKDIYNILNTGRLRDKIWYIRLGTKELPWKDFGEAYEAGEKTAIIKILQCAQQFKDYELI